MVSTTFRAAAVYLAALWLVGCSTEGVEPDLCSVDADSDGASVCEDCDDNDAARSPLLLEVCDGQDNDCNGTVDESAPEELEGGGAGESIPPEGQTGSLDATIDVETDGEIGEVEVRVQFSHAYHSDLWMMLRSPGGSSALLSGGHGGGGSGPVDVWFSDSGGQSIVDGSYLEDGPLRPEEPLATFVGERAAGRWILEVEDWTWGNTGTLVGWTLSLSGAGMQDADGDGSPACEDCDDEDSGLFPGQEEVCDGIDNDCDEVVDENLLDGDFDGFDLCSDCDDAASEVHPGAEEVCDGVDNDCDGWDDCPLTAEQQEALEWGKDQVAIDCVDLLSLRGLIMARVSSDEAEVCPSWIEEDATEPFSESDCPFTCDPDDWECDCTANSSVTQVVGGCTTGAGDTYSGEITLGQGSLSWHEWGDLSQNVSEAAWELEATDWSAAPASTPISTWLASLGGWLDGASETRSGSSDLGPDGPVYDSSERSCSATLEAGVTAGSLGPLLPGASVLTLVGSQQDGSYYSSWVDNSEDSTRALAGTISWEGEAAWVFDADLDWWSGAENGTPVGCGVEPQKGTVAITLLDGPGGSPTSVITVEFDGETACDGCGVLSRDGVPLFLDCGGWSL